VLDERGGIRADLTVMRLAGDHYRVVTGAGTGNIDRKWFADRMPADGTAYVVDQTSAWTTSGCGAPARATSSARSPMPT
jgi:glycine cleavage system aminomethyltransferase T